MSPQTVQPSHTADNPVMQMAWEGFVRWALEKEEIRAEFTQETGLDLDGITFASSEGVQQAHGTLERFIDWVTEAYWGQVQPKCGPVA